MKVTQAELNVAMTEVEAAFISGGFTKEKCPIFMAVFWRILTEGVDGVNSLNDVATQMQTVFMTSQPLRAKVLQQWINETTNPKTGRSPITVAAAIGAMQMQASIDNRIRTLTSSFMQVVNEEIAAAAPARGPAPHP